MKKLSFIATMVVLTACSGATETAERASSKTEPAATQASVDKIKKEAAEKAMVAKERAEKEAMAAKETAEKQAMVAKERAEKAAMQAKERAEKDAMAAKEQAEKAAMVAQEKAKKEAMIATERAEKEAMAAQEAAQEAAKRNAANRETARLEAERQVAANQEAARQDAIRQEAARQETARLEAERLEAARVEAARAEAESAAAAASAYKVLSSGGWRKKSFSVSGNWTMSSENGVTRVNLDNQFSTKNAPDLKIFLSPLSPDELTGRNATQGALLVSPLRSNKGAQTYTVPAGTNLSRYKTILIHCEAYSKLWSVSGL